MATNELYALVVEDDPIWSERLRRAVETIMRDRGYAADPAQNITQAKNVEEATRLIEEKPKFNLVTMDIDLGDGQNGRGLDLLGKLRQKQAVVVSVVISGRGSEKPIWTSSVNEHQVFMVLDKKDTDEIRPALQAALQYAHALRLKEAQQFDKALQAVRGALEQFPKLGIFKDALNEITELAETFARDQSTGLAGLDAVHKRINEMRISSRPWEIASIKIGNYAQFREAYTSFNSSEATKLIAQMLNKTVDEYGLSLTPASIKDDLFLGYMGENEFILLTYADTGNHMAALEAAANRNFEEIVRSFYNALDLEEPNPRFTKDDLMHLIFNKKSISVNEYASVGIDQFLEEVWASDADKRPSEW